MRTIFNLQSSIFNLQWIKCCLLAVAIVCGPAMFTSCTANDDNPASPADDEAQRERTELLTRIESDTKLMADNFSADGLNAATQATSQLLGVMDKSRNFMPNLQQLIAMMATKSGLDYIKPVEQGSELERMGYKAYIPVDISTFGVRVVFSERGDYDITPSNGLEFIFPATIDGLGATVCKMTFRSSDGWYETVSPAKLGNVKGLACVSHIPSSVTMTLSALRNNEETALLRGELNIGLKKNEQSGYVNLKESNCSLNGQISEFLQGDDPTGQDGCLNFNLGISQGELTNIDFDFTQKGLKMMDFNALLNSTEANVKIDILDGLILRCTMDKVQSTMDKVQSSIFNLQSSMNNEQWSIATPQMKSEVPMRLVEEQKGDRRVIVPTLKFADEPDFIPLSELVSEETMDALYGLFSESTASVGNAATQYSQLLSKVVQLLPVDISER